MSLWNKNGTQDRVPMCPFCGADEVRARYSKAWCRGCQWEGELAELLVAEERRRPGLNLLAILAEKGMQLVDFAVELWPNQSRTGALANIRKYTHAGSKGSPSPAMVLRWAAMLNVERERFTAPVPAVPLWRNQSLPTARRVRAYFDAHPKSRVTLEQLAKEIDAPERTVKYILVRSVSSGAMIRTAAGAYKRARASGAADATKD